MISDYTLSRADKGGDVPKVGSGSSAYDYKFVGTVTRHSVADGYSGTMSGDYWTTADGFNYPVFTSAVPFLTQSI